MQFVVFLSRIGSLGYFVIIAMVILYFIEERVHRFGTLSLQRGVSLCE